MRVEEFVLEILEGGIIELKLPLECPVRHTLALTEEVDDLIEEGIKVHMVASPGSPLPDQSASAGAPHVRSYVPQQGEKGKGQVWGQAGETVGTRSVCHTPDPPAFSKTPGEAPRYKSFGFCRPVGRLWQTPSYGSAVRLWTLRVAGAGVCGLQHGHGPGSLLPASTRVGRCQYMRG
jgi:hypothetical protein